MHRLAAYSLLATLAWFGLGRATETQAQTNLPAYDIVIKDGRFTPARLEVPAGQKLRLNLRNEGPGALEFENPDMHIEKVLGAGASSFVVLPKLEPGQYDFTDEFNPVTGNLTVIAQ
jgi:plastocyanin domain-containing protein